MTCRSTIRHDGIMMPNDVIEEQVQKDEEQRNLSYLVTRVTFGERDYNYQQEKAVLRWRNLDCRWLR